MSDDINKPAVESLTKEVLDLKKQIEQIEESLAETADPEQALAEMEKKKKK